MSWLKALLASELGCLSLSIFVVPCIRFRRSKGGRAPPFLNESWPRLEGVGFLPHSAASYTLIPKWTLPVFARLSDCLFGLACPGKSRPWHVLNWIDNDLSSNSAMSSIMSRSTTPFLTHILNNVIISPFPSRWSPAIRCRPAATPVAPALTQSQVVTLSPPTNWRLPCRRHSTRRGPKVGKAAGGCGRFFNMLKRTVERTEHSCEGCQRGFFMCRHVILQFFSHLKIGKPKISHIPTKRDPRGCLPPKIGLSSGFQTLRCLLGKCLFRKNGVVGRRHQNWLWCLPLICY